MQEFLQSCDWHRANPEPLLGDASARRYTRLVSRNGAARAMLMDAPPGKGLKTRAFIDMARWLVENGLSAPEIIEADATNGFVLLEDLGDGLFTDICARTGDQEQTLYGHGVDVLTALRNLQPLPDLPPYSVHTYLSEANLLTDWYLPIASGVSVSADIRDTYSALIREACDSLPNDASCTVLRDYHADNLIWLPDRSPLARVGLLDFQDALLGHPAYDLVSLLQDARRDVSDDLHTAMMERFLSDYKENHDAFLMSYATLGAQRNLKIIGIFSRLCLRDSKPGYIDMIPRVWRHLKTDLSHPSLAKLRAFVERHIPEPSAAILERIRRGAP